MMGVTLTGSILLSLSNAAIVNRGHTNSWNEHHLERRFFVLKILTLILRSMSWVMLWVPSIRLVKGKNNFISFEKNTPLASEQSFPLELRQNVKCKDKVTKSISFKVDTRSSWLNYALRDNEAVFWVSIRLYEAMAVGNWWYWVSRGHLCLYILQKVGIWKGVMHAWLTHKGKIELLSSL